MYPAANIMSTIQSRVLCQVTGQAGYVKYNNIDIMVVLLRYPVGNRLT